MNSKSYTKMFIFGAASMYFLIKKAKSLKSTNQESKSEIWFSRTPIFIETVNCVIKSVLNRLFMTDEVFRFWEYSDGLKFWPIIL